MFHTLPIVRNFDSSTPSKSTKCRPIKGLLLANVDVDSYSYRCRGLGLHLHLSNIIGGISRNLEKSCTLRISPMVKIDTFTIKL